MEDGERMFVWCDGGPATGRAVQFPPPFEIDVDGGTYVLVDDGPPEHWRYEFVAADIEWLWMIEPLAAAVSVCRSLCQHIRRDPT